MENGITVDKYERLIHKMAWKHSQKWGIDEPEMYAEGLYIFVLTLTKFQEGKGLRFSTYLTHRLQGRLDKYGAKEKRHTFHEEPYDIEDPEDPIYQVPNEWHERFIRNMEYWETISTDLSDDALNVLGLILQSLENTTYNRRPSLHGATRYFRLFGEWPQTRTKKAWNEVKNWWTDLNCAPLRV